MSDVHTLQQRHNNMAAIRSKDTKPEIIVRRGLWKRGFRYRLNHNRLWHGHQVDMKAPENSECCKIPKTNRDFWVTKIRRNKERDREEQRTLASMGWHCITVWECELKPQKSEETLDSIAFTLNHIWLQDHRAKSVPYPKLEEEDMQMAAEEVKSLTQTESSREV